MSLRDSLTENREAPAKRAETPRSWRLSPAKAALKARIHEKLLGLVDLGALERMAPEQLRVELKVLVERLLTEERSAINEAERKQIILDIQDEVMGLGPIEPLLADITVSDILVNNSAQVFVERAGRLERTDLLFDDDQHLMRIIEKIVSRIGRRVDESSPMVDARLPDGSRVNAVIPPLALDG